MARKGEASQSSLMQKEHEEELHKLYSLRAKEVPRAVKVPRQVVTAKYKMRFERITQALADSGAIQ